MSQPQLTDSITVRGLSALVAHGDGDWTPPPVIQFEIETANGATYHVAIAEHARNRCRAVMRTSDRTIRDLDGEWNVPLTDVVTEAIITALADSGTAHG